MPGCRCAKTAFREVGRGSRGETAKPRCDQPHSDSPSPTRTAAAMALALSLSSLLPSQLDLASWLGWRLVCGRCSVLQHTCD